MRLSELPADSEVACPPTATKAPRDCFQRFVGRLGMAEEDMTASPRRAHFGGLSGRSDGLSTQAHRRLGRLAYPSPPTAAGRLAADGTMRGGSNIVLIAVIVVVGVVAS